MQTEIIKKLIAGDATDIWSGELLLIKQIEAEAKKYFQKASGCHDWTHVERVRALALKIGKKEKADLGILELAALLHDIHKPEEMRSKGKFCHAERGAKTARIILKKYGAGESIINEVAHCIASHRTRNNNNPETVEAKVLRDADKLDGIGAIGIARDFQFAGYIAARLSEVKMLYTGREREQVKSGRRFDYTKDDSALLEYELNMKKVKDKLLTKEGKRIGGARHKFMEKFFERFWEEVKAGK
jgi:uncharacterized protein